MKKLTLACLAGIVVLLTILACLPATLVASKFSQAFPAVDVPDAQGVWWRGQANQVSVLYRGYALPVNTVRWQYDWQTVLTRQWCGTFTTQSPTINSDGYACFDPKRRDIVVKNISVNISATELAELYGLEISGDFTGYLQKIRVKNNQLLAVYGELSWQQAQFYNGVKWFDLGELLLSISTANNHRKISIVWSDIESLLKMNVTTDWYKQRAIKVTGYIEPQLADVSRVLEGELSKTLSLISQQQQGNRFIFDNRFALP